METQEAYPEIKTPSNEAIKTIRSCVAKTLDVSDSKGKLSFKVVLENFANNMGITVVDLLCLRFQEQVKLNELLYRKQLAEWYKFAVSKKIIDPKKCEIKLPKQTMAGLNRDIKRITSYVEFITKAHDDVAKFPSTVSKEMKKSRSGFEMGLVF